MEQAFGISQDNFPWLTWATASWNVGGLGEVYCAGFADIFLGAALFPLLFVPLTENSGRMPGYFVRAFLVINVQAHTKTDFLRHLFDLPRAIWRGYQLRDHGHHEVLRRRGELGFHQYCRRDHRGYRKLVLPSPFMC